MSPSARESEFLFTRRSLLVILGLSTIFVALLYLMGRPAWCKYGLGFWAPAWTPCTSQDLFDPYALTHVLHGVIFFWLLQPLAGRITLSWRFVIAVGLEIVWEIGENSPWVIQRYRQDTAAFDYTGDSILNAIGDLVTTGIGFAFASRFSWKASAALFILLEIAALVLARDNLTLNVIMLLFPIDAIKTWQMPG
jgi:hypothetical protein